MLKKLAHNPTTSAFAGNKALRPLQGLITAEKAIITSLGQLSIHFSRASEALRIWGHGEGEDLSDTLGASTKLLLEFSLSLRKFAAHEQTIREHMKAVRTHEENLDRLRSRRKTVASKADSAERKLNKMDPAHKDAAAQSNLLEQLRDAIRELDSEIMTAEAKLGDLKRTATKAWMVLKFGGLEECCRKGLIVSESGKRVMAELPQESTAPGLARSLYMGHARTDAYVADALRSLAEVSIDPSAPSGQVQFPLDANYQDSDLHPMPSTLPNNDSSVSLSRGGLPGDGDEPLQYRGQYDSDAPRPSSGEEGDYGWLPATSQADEHGAFPPRTDIPRFQSFSSRKPPPPSFYNNPLGYDVPSLSQQIASPNPTSGRFATFPVKGKRQDSAAQMIAEPLAGSRSTFLGAGQAPPQGDAEDGVSRSEAIEGGHIHPLRPPPGAAPPVLPSTATYGGYDPGSYDSGPPFFPDEKGDDSQLPYMASERRVPLGSRPLPVPHPLEHADREATTTEARLTSPEGESTPLATTQAPVFKEGTPTPPPAVDDPYDERALNAAAAREVSRELDSLMYQPPTVMPKGSPSQASTPARLSIPPVASSPPRSSSDSVAQPSSPFTRARGRRSGSPEEPRSSVEQPSTSVSSPPPYVTSVPSSPTQKAPLPPPSIAAALPSSPSLSGVSSPPYRTPPEVPSTPVQRTLPQPLAMSHSPVVKTPPRAGAGMISVAAFRRPAPRTVSEPQPSPVPQDVSPLSIKERDLRNSPNAPRMSGTFNSFSPIPGAQPSEPVAHSPHEQLQEEEFDYLTAYYNSGVDEESSARSGILR